MDFTKDFEQQDMKYDSTGMFHWCPARNLDECVLVRISLLKASNSLEIICNKLQSMFRKQERDV